MHAEVGDLVRLCTDDYSTDYQVGLVVEVVSGDDPSWWWDNQYKVLLSKTLKIKTFFFEEIEMKIK